MITLIHEGTEYGMWTSAEVTAGMAKATRSFKFEAAELSGAEIADLYWFAPGDDVEVRVDGEAVCVGHVNEYAPTIGPGNHSVSVSGRGKSQDVVDSSVTRATPIKDRGLGDAVRDLASEVNIEVTFPAAANNNLIARFQVDQGERIIDAIHRLARAHGWGVMGRADGHIELVRSDDASKTELLLMEGAAPFHSASAVIKDTERFSTFRMKTQIASDADRYGAEAAQEVRDFVDGGAPRTRPYVSIVDVSTSSQTAGESAEWVMRRMAGKNTQVNLTVTGHSYEGQVWAPKTLVYVVSPSLKLAHELLIETVTFRQSEAGSFTDLKLVPQKAAGKKSSDAPSAGPSEVAAAYEGAEPAASGTDKPQDYGSQWNWAAEARAQ